MGLFQSTIQKKYLKGAEGDISALYRLFTSYYFEKLRFNIDNAIDFVEFNLFTLRAGEFALLWLFLSCNNEYQPFYDRFKLYFKYMNEGHKGKAEDIFGYNGGLLKPDELSEYKAACTDLANQIRITDREIDRMVYGLYGLTEEEVRIIDPEFSLKENEVDNNNNLILTLLK